MIHRVSIENFYSVSERQLVELAIPANAPDLPSFRASRSNSDKRLPVVVGFFGPNASGKSTVLRAIVALAWFSSYSFKLEPTAAVPLFNPFAHQDWWNLPSKISVDFDCQMEIGGKSSIFRYELHITHAPEKSAKSVAYEALFYAPNGRFRTVFRRENQEFSFGREFGLQAHDPRIKSIRPNASVLSTLAQLNHTLSTNLISAINGLQTNLQGLTRLDGNAEKTLSFYLKNPDFLARLNQELSRLDLGLEEMKVIRGDQGPIATFRHVGLGCEIIMALESAGTQRFIQTFPLLQVALDVGGVAIIDELDTEIHPLLIPELFRWFYSADRNLKNAQLIFTAHNTAILDELEKEQVYFTEKPFGRPTRIFCAGDIQGLRRQPSLTKKYLSGELGAVPRIG
jgi:uncharacterized protein